MGIFIKFKCWSCNKTQCTCKKKKTKKLELLYSNSEPKVTTRDLIVQNNNQYIITKVEADGITYKQLVSFDTYEDESILNGEYFVIKSTSN